MQVSALQCPRCFAPVDASHVQISACRYCGATLAIQGGAVPAPAPGVVFLESAGANPIGVIKVVKENTGLGLRESKELVDRAPCEVGDRVEPHRVARFRDELLRAGARIR